MATGHLAARRNESPYASALRIGLGDEWFSPETVRVLERALLKAPYAAGRLGALHGVEHAINHSDPTGRKRLFRLLRKVSRSDRSERVR